MTAPAWVVTLFSERVRDRVRPWAVAVLLVLSVAAIGASRMVPTPVERCVDAGQAAGWNGTASELWTECIEQTRGQ